MSIPVLLLGTMLGGEGEISPVLTQVFAIVMLMIPNLFTVEGGIFMVLLGLIFYIFRTNRKIQFLVLIILSFLAFLYQSYRSTVDDGICNYSAIFL